MKDETVVYYVIDNILKTIDKNSKKNKVGRPGTLSIAEYVTLAILKQDMGIKTMKKFYELIETHMKKDFPNVPSY